MKPGEIVRMLGPRLREIREGRGMALRNFYFRRSWNYGWKLERGDHIPSAGYLERLMEVNHLGPGLFAERFLGDAFALEVVPFLKRLREDQRQHILHVLAAAPVCTRDAHRNYGGAR